MPQVKQHAGQPSLSFKSVMKLWLLLLPQSYPRLYCRWDVAKYHVPRCGTPTMQRTQQIGSGCSSSNPRLIISYEHSSTLCRKAAALLAVYHGPQGSSSAALTCSTRTRLNSRSMPEFEVAWFAVKKPATMKVTNCASSLAAKAAVEYKIMTSICNGEGTARWRE